MTSELKSRIIDLVRNDLERVEQALESQMKPNLDLVKDIASHLLFSGGKRYRPLLMIHSARLCGYDGGYEIEFSTIFEYLHVASLLHDDVVDEAWKRRGKETAHSRFGVPRVVLTGDFLMARSLSIASEVKDPSLIDVIARITTQMAQGEIEQMGYKGDAGLKESDYLRIIHRKTGVLLEGACKSGAVLAKASEKEQDTLSRFGRHLGLAFQMTDDLLDYTATADTLGKEPGTDIREGKLTLPLIAALENAGTEDAAFIMRMVENPGIGMDEFERLKQVLYRCGGIEYTQQQAMAHAKEAMACLEMFRDSASRRLLKLLAEYSIARNE